MTTPGPFNLATTYLRLRADNSAETLPFNDQFWPRLMSGALGDFHLERLVVLSSFAETWKSWEMHPNGDEIVCLVSGKVSMVLEIDGRERVAELAAPGDYVFVPPYVPHREENPSADEPAVVVIARSTQEAIVVNLPSLWPNREVRPPGRTS